MKHFSFNNLFILDLANNHQGDAAHGRRIIEALGLVVRTAGVHAAIKFQFRQLDTFIHPAHQVGSNAAHVPRFLSTRLSSEDYTDLVSVVRENNMVTMCTPFDEDSVGLICEMDFDAIKVASCSITDMPLLEEIAKAGKPVVISTGGCPISEIDRVVHLMTRNNVLFALEHCVSIYPTPSEKLSLNQIDLLKNRYPEIPIGWSTHEEPDDTVTVQLAFAKGATIFERHVGLATDQYSLNQYSSNPGQIADWLQAFKSAAERCGPIHRSPATTDETVGLHTLARGVFANRDINDGEAIQRQDVFFAMPATNEGMLVSQWKEGLVANIKIPCNAPIPDGLGGHTDTAEHIVDQIMLQVRGMLHVARIKLAETSTIELSHHYGLQRFREFGAVIIQVINREYCKKIIIQLPRQKHPYHHHKKKEETFQVLSGELEVEKNGNSTSLNPGDIYLVEPGHWHKFSTFQGVIFEEISTTHFNDDSYYEDPAINMMPRQDRKTIIENWEL